MNIKHIRVFVAVYDEGSVTAAGKKLGLTQPATSLAIRELEEYYNTKFFERDGRSIRPTDAATELYKEAARLISLYDEMDDKMKNWNEKGVIKIGSSISIGSCILPKLVIKYKRIHKDLTIKVVVDNSDVIQDMIIQNKLDFAFVEGDVNHEGIIKEVFMDDELVPICGRFHKFADRDDVKVSELNTESFLMREKESGTRQQAESHLAAKGVKIDPIWESTSTAALSNAVAAGLGVSILPLRMVEDSIKTNKIKTFHIKGIKLTRKYSIVYHKNKFLSESMKDFIDLAKKESNI